MSYFQYFCWHSFFKYRKNELNIKKTQSNKVCLHYRTNLKTLHLVVSFYYLFNGNYFINLPYHRWLQWVLEVQQVLADPRLSEESTLRSGL